MLFRTLFDFALNFPKTVFFNFYNLPFRQAIKLPIYVHRKVQLASLTGKIILEDNALAFRSIKLGVRIIGVYPSTLRSVLENYGTIIFKGKASIGGGFGISVNKNGVLVLGEDFLASSSMKLVCISRVSFGKHARIGWESIIVDSDFHDLIDEKTDNLSVRTSEVILGDSNWLGMRTMILKGTRTPNYCIIGASSLVRSDFTQYGEKILLAGNPAKFIRDKIYREISKE